MKDLHARVSKALRHFWKTRQHQAQAQGAATGQKDYGERGSVTGGAQLDGFIHLIRDLLREAGLPAANIYCKTKTNLPGFFRPEKSWDLLAVAEGHLLAALEFKSQVGPSFGNNFNNRTEEVLGCATDLWTAYREGVFAPSQRPWLGFVMLLEESPGSTRPVKVTEPHFRVLDEFRAASYAKRYEILLTRLLRERLYDGTCLITSTRTGGLRGIFQEPSAELAFEGFARSLLGHAMAFAELR
jgi:hypothetical protein